MRTTKFLSSGRLCSGQWPMTVLTSGGSTARRSEGTSFESRQSGELSATLERSLPEGRDSLKGVFKSGLSHRLSEPADQFVTCILVIYSLQQNRFSGVSSGSGSRAVK